VTVPNDNASTSRYDGAERRTYQHLRDVFEEAYRIAYPLLESKEVDHTAGQTHFLRIVLHDTFPNLHLQDVAILSVSIERVYRERSKTGTP
jgi:hypothetical protein